MKGSDCDMDGCRFSSSQCLSLENRNTLLKKIFSPLKFLLLFTFFSFLLGSVDSAQAATRKCYCHNICHDSGGGGSGDQCTSNEGQQNGHQESADCNTCLQGLGESCSADKTNTSCFDPGSTPDSDGDGQACPNKIEDTFGKCNGCGDGNLDNNPGCCNPNIQVCNDPNNLCESCDDGNNQDGDGCNQNCQKECAGGCDDHEPCTSDSCDGATGLCKNIPMPGISCDDNNLCTDTDLCQANGSCSGSPVTCDPPATCFNEGVCDPTDGLCDYTPKTQGSPCDDVDQCNGDESCDGAGLCLPGDPVTCDDGKNCTSEECNPSNGACSCTPLTGNECNDLNICTVEDECQASSCTEDLADGGGCHGTPRDCGDHNVCTDDSCAPSPSDPIDPNRNEVTGCVNTPNTNSCDDGDPCTENDTCGDKECHGTPIEGCQRCKNAGDCDDENACTDDVCNDLGVCENPPTAEGSACGSKSDTDCDNPDTCDGSGTCKPNNEPNTTVCRPDTGECDVEEKCDGAGSCPADGFEPAGTSCGSNSDTVCDNPDTCNASGACQPNNEADNDPCTADSNECTDDVCQAGVCSHPNDNSNSCSDGDACTQTDACVEGTCQGSNPVTCSALDECHVAGVCDPGSGQCSNPNKDNGTACTADSNECTDDVCQAGVCSHPNDDTNTCNDDKFCTIGDSCTAGVCGGTPMVCAGDQCNSGVCNEELDRCDLVPANEGDVCDDGLFCTDGDTCTLGTCGGEARDCSTESDQCNNGVCNEESDACEAEPANEGGNCDDGLFCTDGDTCTAGTCGGEARDCSGEDDQCNLGFCNEGSNACEKEPVNEGNECDDGLFCTVEDICSSGTCGGEARDCSAESDQCNDGVCDEGQDQCEKQPANEGGSCGDGNACTNDDICTGGQCDGTFQEGCQECEGDEICNDGNLCNGEEFCGEGGTCQSGDPLVCSDGDACNGVETCLAETGCVEGTPVICNDGRDCSSEDTCNPETGQCQFDLSQCVCDTPEQCNDANQCTSDSCDLVFGQCVNDPEPQGTPCDDGNAATANDQCDGGGNCKGTSEPEDPIRAQKLKCAQNLVAESNGKISAQDAENLADELVNQGEACTLLLEGQSTIGGCAFQPGVVKVQVPWVGFMALLLGWTPMIFRRAKMRRR